MYLTKCHQFLDSVHQKHSQIRGLLAVRRTSGEPLTPLVSLPHQQDSTRTNLLVPRITQNTRALGDRLLLETGPPCSRVIVLRVTLHVGDFVEQSSIGLR